jgi:hypothetical protein
MFANVKDVAQARALRSNSIREGETLDVITYYVDMNGEPIGIFHLDAVGLKARLVVYNANHQGWRRLDNQPDSDTKATIAAAMEELLDQLNYEMSLVSSELLFERLR